MLVHLKNSEKVFLVQIATSGFALGAPSNLVAQAKVAQTDGRASALGSTADAVQSTKRNRQNLWRVKNVKGVLYLEVWRDPLQEHIHFLLASKWLQMADARVAPKKRK